MRYCFARSLLALSLFFLAQVAFAKDLGVVGQTYAIGEDDFLQVMESRYNKMKDNGEWEQVQKNWQNQIVHYADRPSPVFGITHTTKRRIYYFDPSIALSKDIITPTGQLIAKSGTVLNPLAIVPLHKALLFIDADDPRQIVWAMRMDKTYEGKTKWILVNGSVSAVVKKLQKPVYFDQVGKLTSHFKIQHIPALLQQEGLVLKIEECLP